MTKDRRYPITALEQNCLLTFQTVFSSDSGVWQCQTPETRSRSKEIYLDVVGRLGSPIIKPDTGMLHLEKDTCFRFNCSAKIGLRTSTQMTWTDQKTGQEIQDFISHNNSLTSLTHTSLLRSSSIEICVKGNMDLLCNISSDFGKFRLSLPLR